MKWARKTSGGGGGGGVGAFVVAEEWARHDKEVEEKQRVGRGKREKEGRGGIKQR